MASSQYWGEIYCEEDNEVFNSALTLEDLTKPRQLDTKGPLLFQPSSRHHSPSNEPLPEKWFQIDPITLHTISLIQYAKKARQAIQIMNQHQTDNIPEHRRKIPVLPPFPVYTGLPLKHVPRGPLNFILPDLDNDFACGVGESPPEIDTATNRNLLRRSVAAICAHLSFEGSPESVLETLTDVANEFYLQFMKHMSSAADARSIHKQPTFPDIIEQVFHELGFGSVTTLHDFYHCRVLNYHRRMTETCQALVAEYNNLKLPIAAQPPVSKTHDSVAERETFNVIRIKEEPNGDKFFPMLNASNDNVFDAEHFLHLDGETASDAAVHHPGCLRMILSSARFAFWKLESAL